MQDLRKIFRYARPYRRDLFAAVGLIFNKRLLRLIFGNIAVVQVVNHLWNTSYIEPYARNTTGHCLYDGIG